jgi:methylisocitrate lyase
MSQEKISAGARFRRAAEEEQPLQIVGVTNAYTALLAEQAGFRCLYLSGGGVAYGSFGLPDLGMTNLHDVLEECRRIVSITDLPLLVDIDTGFGSALGIKRTISELERAGAAAVQLEDQVALKRCGHRPGKKLVKTEEMVDRIKAVVDARQDKNFTLVARTDAIGVEGIEAALERAKRYCESGADVIFLEAATDVAQYKQACAQLPRPVLANMTEFGKSPLLSKKELADAGVRFILYPLSAFRAMSKAAQHVFNIIRSEGDQRSVISDMQTRDELYSVLDYKQYEELIDRLFQEQKAE